MKEFELVYRIQEGICIITPIGKLAQGANFKEIQPVIEDDNVKKVLVNGKLIEFIDSSGMGALIDLYKTLLAKNKKLCLCELKRDEFELMTMSGMDHYIPVYKSETEAMISI